MRILIYVGTFAAGFVAGDYVAYLFAREHGYDKRGGIFTYNPDED